MNNEWGRSRYGKVLKKEYRTLHKIKVAKIFFRIVCYCKNTL